MPEQLVTADGAAVSVEESERIFAAAMAAPPASDPEMPLPPAFDPGAPHGRKLDGTPKKAPGGRPPKARTLPPVPAVSPAPAGTKTTAPDYTRPLAEFTDGLWMVLAAVPVPEGNLRIRVRAQAHILKANQPGVVTAVNSMAQHNATIRWGVEKLTLGSAGWVLPAVMALAPFAVQSAQIWRTEPTEGMILAAKDTEQEWDKLLGEMKAQLDGEDAGSPAAA